MDKKELKFYDAPACEVVELKSSTSLLAGSIQTGSDGNPSGPGETPSTEDMEDWG